MPFALLLAMQAAGMIVDYMGTSNQARMMGMGENLQQAGIEANIEQTRLETENESLNAMKNLRTNLGTQIAVQAARGTRSGAGSALSYMTGSVGNFNADEQMRRLNLLGKENQLRGGAAISRLQSMSDVSKLWQGFGQRTLNTFSTRGYGNFGASKGTGGFGLTSVGT